MKTKDLHDDDLDSKWTPGAEFHGLDSSWTPAFRLVIHVLRAHARGCYRQSFVFVRDEENKSFPYIDDPWGLGRVRAGLPKKRRSAARRAALAIDFPCA